MILPLFSILLKPPLCGLILPLFSILLKPPLCGLPVLLLGRCPALLKRHRADIAQRRVQSLVVVEIEPINDFIHGIAPGSKSSAVQSANLQTTPQTLGGCVVPAIALAAH